MTTSRIGAATPIVSYPGSTAMAPVPTAIIASVSVIAGLRPARSAYAPITSAPSGRTTKPSPNTDTDSSRLTNGRCVGKNVRPIITAKVA